MAILDTLMSWLGLRESQVIKIPEAQVRMIEEERHEENYILREYTFVKDISKAIEKGNIRAARNLSRKFSRFEYRLENLHKRVLKSLHILESQSSISNESKNKLNMIISEMNIFANELVLDLSSNGKLKQLMAEEKWEELENLVDEKLKVDLQGWLSQLKFLKNFEKELILSGEINSPAINISSPPSSKLSDLLSGTGQYEQYDQKQRMDLWNSWIKSAPDSQKNFENVNVANKNLRGFELNNCRFSHANFSGAILAGVLISKSEFLHTDFRGANTTGAKFSGCGFYSALFTKTVIECEFTNCRISAYFTKATIKNSNFVDCEFPSSDFQGAALSNVSFQDCRIGGQTDKEYAVSFQGAEITGCIFSDCRLKEVQFSNALSIVSTTFDQSQFEGTKFNNTVIKDCDYNSIRIYGTLEFIQSSLTSVKFRLISKPGNLSLVGAILKSVDFTRSNFSKLDFSGANIEDNLKEQLFEMTRANIVELGKSISSDAANFLKAHIK